MDNERTFESCVLFKHKGATKTTSLGAQYIKWGSGTNVFRIQMEPNVHKMSFSMETTPSTKDSVDICSKESAKSWCPIVRAPAMIWTWTINATQHGRRQTHSAVGLQVSMRLLSCLTRSQLITGKVWTCVLFHQRKDTILVCTFVTLLTLINHSPYPHQEQLKTHACSVKEPLTFVVLPCWPNPKRLCSICTRVITSKY